MKGVSMSGILAVSPPVSPGPQRAEGPATAMAMAPVQPVTRTETVRAPMPVDAATRGLDIRFEDRQGRPVGPPPSFQISLLQAMQEAALEPRSGAATAFADESAVFAAPDQIDRKV
jgi:hypothetical protein